MTDRSAGGPASTGPPKGDAASSESSGSGEERVVVRDKRKIVVEPTGTKPKTGKPGPTKPATGKPEEARPGEAKPAAETAPGPKETPAEAPVAEEPVVEGEVVEPAVDEREPAEDKTVTEHPLGVELEAVRGELEERTRDLQRVGAEYANYRKRVDRDRGVVVEQALGSVLVSLLPVLDDLDRARDHGDLVGPFASVAEQLTGALAKYGLTPFGEKGDPFDPARHEAVAHLTSAEVTEPTCIDVLRRGYLLGDRLLRPALVAVAEPEPE